MKMGFVIIEEMMKDGTPIRMESMGILNRVIVSPKKYGKTYKFSFSFKTRNEAEKCFLDFFNETAQLWQYVVHLPNDQRIELRKFLSPQDTAEELKFTPEQEDRISEIYEQTIDLCSFFTDGKFDVEDVSTYGELADVIAEFLTNHGYAVYFPTHIEDENENRIVDVYE